MNEHGFDCREIDASLALFAAGELEAAAREAVGRHLSVCAGCRGRADLALRARSALIEGGHARARHTPDLWPGVRRALIAEDLLREPAGRAAAAGPLSTVQAGRVPPWTWAAAAAAILAAGVYFVRGHGTPDAAPHDSGLVAVPAPHTAPEGRGLPGGRAPGGREPQAELPDTDEPAPNLRDPRSAPTRLVSDPGALVADPLVADQGAESPPASLPAGSRLRRLGPGEVPLHAQTELEVFVPGWQGPGRWLRAPEGGDQPASWIEAAPATR